jgi:hypothetical protein
MKHLGEILLIGIPTLLALTVVCPSMYEDGTRRAPKIAEEVKTYRITAQGSLGRGEIKKAQEYASKARNAIDEFYEDHEMVHGNTRPLDIQEDSLELIEKKLKKLAKQNENKI